MTDFKLPEAYADFVSSPSSLLEQFSSASGSAADCVLYEIYPDTENPSSGSLLSLCEKRFFRL